MGFGSYETALCLTHRVRAPLADPGIRKLMGIVEVDKTFVGSESWNRQWNKRALGTGGAGKAAVKNAVGRDGNVVARVVSHVDTQTAGHFVNAAVAEGVDLVAADESGVCHRINRFRPHESVNHGRSEYVRRNVHTCTIDCFWPLLKRGIIDTFHNVSRKCLPLYVVEFEWHYNNWTNPVIFGAAVARC